MLLRCGRSLNNCCLHYCGDSSSSLSAVFSAYFAHRLADSANRGFSRRRNTSPYSFNQETFRAGIRVGSPGGDLDRYLTHSGRISGGGDRDPDALGRDGLGGIRQPAGVFGSGRGGDADAASGASENRRGFIGCKTRRGDGWGLAGRLSSQICPADGVVVEGHGRMNEAYLTGEPFEMAKTPGSEVISGSTNGDAALHIRAERLAVDSRYARIMRVMQDAEQRRPRLRRLGDTLGAWYTPVALTLAGIALAASGESHRFLAVLVVATPCHC